RRAIALSRLPFVSLGEACAGTGVRRPAPAEGEGMNIPSAAGLVPSRRPCRRGVARRDRPGREFRTGPVLSPVALEADGGIPAQGVIACGHRPLLIARR